MSYVLFQVYDLHRLLRLIDRQTCIPSSWNRISNDRYTYLLRLQPANQTVSLVNLQQRHTLIRKTTMLQRNQRDRVQNQNIN